MPGSTYMAKGCLYIYSWIFLYTYKGKYDEQRASRDYRSLSASVMIIKVMCYHVPLFRFLNFDFNFLKLYQKFLNSYKKFF